MGGTVLAEAYQINTTLASAACSMIWLGIGLGSPVLGWWSDHIGRRCFPLALVAFIGVIATIVVIYGTGLPFSLMFVFLFLIGVASSGQALSFGLVKDRSNPANTGTAIGFNNMAVVAGGALFQPLIGVLLHLNWDGTMSDGVPVYAAANYRVALIALPVCYLFAAILATFFLKETYCQPQFPLIQAKE